MEDLRIHSEADGNHVRETKQVEIKANFLENKVGTSCSTETVVVDGIGEGGSGAQTQRLFQQLRCIRELIGDLKRSLEGTAGEEERADEEEEVYCGNGSAVVEAEAEKELSAGVLQRYF